MGRGAAVGLTLISAVAWGLWWIPIRALEQAGVEGLWASLAMCVGMLPALGWIARRDPAGSPRAMGGAVLIGAAMMLYGAALAFTDIVRAVLLFYLAPAWSTAIECLFLGRRWTRWSALALGLSFFGVATIFRFEVSVDGWSVGDTAAALSGLAWSAGAALVFTAPEAGAPGRWRMLTLAAACGAVGCGALAAFAGGPAAGAAPSLSALPAAILGMVFGALYLAPTLGVALWGALRLPPATMSFLLTAEIVAGVASSALLLDERFGLPEALGAVLVASAALLESLAPRGAATPRATRA
jgi:drug/metabolite transporter (DMT)-like permease